MDSGIGLIYKIKQFLSKNCEKTDPSEVVFVLGIEFTIMVYWNYLKEYISTPQGI